MVNLGNFLMTVAEAAKYLHISQSTVYRLAERGELTHIKKRFGVRFRKEEIDEWLDKDKQKNIWPTLIAQDKLTKSSYGRLNNRGIRELASSKNKTRYDLGFGYIYQRKTKSGKARWYLDYRDSGNKRIQKVIPHAVAKEEAAIALRQEVGRTFQKTYGLEGRKQNLDFKTFSDLYLKNYSMVKKRAWEKSDKVYLNANLNPFFGDHRLDSIDTELIERYIAKRLDEKVTKSTINRDLSCLKKIFNKAVDWGYLSINPALKIKQFQERDNFRSRVLSPEEEVKLAGQLKSQVQEMVSIALGTGLRLGEILNLSWEQVDLIEKRIRVEKTKSGKIRHVPINTTLMQALSRLKGQNGASRYVFPNPRTKRPYTTIKTAFKAACRRSGLKNLRFHDLRRTFATRLLQRGADIETVRDLLGHYSILVTQRYTHTNEEVRRRAVELLSQAPPETPQSAENLLHSCDMAKKSQPSDLIKLMISVN